MSDEILDALDPEQRAVATELDVPVVVLAGAGTGKTRAITHRVAYAVREGRYDPVATLAVTFTTRAAGEMRLRLAKLGVRRAQARTIHSAALRQCQYFWPQAYGSEFPAVLDQPFGVVARSARSVVGDSPNALVRDLLTEISWAKSSNVTPDNYPDLAAGREVGSVSPSQVAGVMRAYDQAKTAQGVVDFDDILLCAAALMAERPEVAETIRQTYRHFVVDEYQDISAVQHRLIGLWADERSDICVVGDPQQAIHGFAGARADLLTGYARQFPGSRTVRLTRNYRSTPQIIEVSNTLVRPHSARLRAVGAQGASPSFHRETNEEAEVAATAEWLRQRHAAGTPWHELAVLYRINAQSPPLEAALTELGVPYSVRGSEKFFERAEVRQAIQGFQRAAEQSPQAPAAELASAVGASLGWDEAAPAGQGRQRERWESLRALRETIEAELAIRSTWTSHDLMVWLAERAAWQAAPEAGAVTLSTMHAAKGLEWDDVAVVGVREGLVPFAASQAEPALSEERRLLYVALTRARYRLRVSWTAPRGSGRSRFLGGVSAALSAAEVVGASAPTSTLRSINCRVCGHKVSSSAERKLGRHVDCDGGGDEELFQALRQWRASTATEASVPAFVVFTDATLRAIAESEPSSRADLLRVSGVGTTKADRYGQACLEIVATHRQARQR
ncbi:MAG: ATP-dependent DNA helicase UvrD2 [Arachnia sp.]